MSDTDAAIRNTACATGAVETDPSSQLSESGVEAEPLLYGPTVHANRLTTAPVAQQPTSNYNSSDQNDFDKLSSHFVEMDEQRKAIDFEQRLRAVSSQARFFSGVASGRSAAAHSVLSGSLFQMSDDDDELESSTPEDEHLSTNSSPRHSSFVRHRITAFNRLLVEESVAVPAPAGFPPPICECYDQCSMRQCSDSGAFVWVCAHDACTFYKHFDLPSEPQCLECMMPEPDHQVAHNINTYTDPVAASPGSAAAAPPCTCGFKCELRRYVEYSDTKTRREFDLWVCSARACEYWTVHRQGTVITESPSQWWSNHHDIIVPDAEICRILAPSLGPPATCDCGKLCRVVSCRNTGDMFWGCAEMACYFVDFAKERPALTHFDFGNQYPLGSVPLDRYTTLRYVMRWMGYSFSFRFFLAARKGGPEDDYPVGSYSFAQQLQDAENQNSQLVARQSGNDFDDAHFDVFLSYRGATHSSLMYLALCGFLNLMPPLIALLFVFPVIAGLLFLVEDPCAVGNVPHLFLECPDATTSIYYGGLWFVFVPYGAIVLIFCMLLWYPVVAPVFGSTKVFFDKYCVNQVNPTQTGNGILRLPAYLKRTKVMWSMFDSYYAQRLWCVFELACYLRLREQPKVEFVSVSQESLGVIAVIYIVFQSALLYIFDTVFSSGGDSLFEVDKRITGNDYDATIDTLLADRGLAPDFVADWSGSPLNAWYDRGSWASHTGALAWVAWAFGCLLMLLVFLLGQQHFQNVDALRCTIATFSIKDASLGSEPDRPILLQFVNELFTDHERAAESGLDRFNKFVQTAVPRYLPVAGVRSWALFNYRTAVLTGAGFLLGIFDVFAFHAADVENPFLGYAQDRPADRSFGSPQQFYFSDAWQGFRTVVALCFVSLVMVPLGWFYVSVEIRFLLWLQQKTGMTYAASAWLFAPLFVLWECVLAYPAMFFANIERLTNFAIVGGRSLPCFRWQQYYDCSPTRYSQPPALFFQVFYGMGFLWESSGNLFDFRMAPWITVMIWLFIIVPFSILTWYIYEPMWSLNVRSFIGDWISRKYSNDNTRNDAAAEGSTTMRENFRAVSTPAWRALVYVFMSGPFLFIIVFWALMHDGWSCQASNAPLETLYLRCVRTSVASTSNITEAIFEAGGGLVEDILRVPISLDLRSNRLYSLPTELVQAEELPIVSLDLRDNFLTDITGQWSCDARIFRELQALRVSDNMLSGSNRGSCVLSELIFLDAARNGMVDARPLASTMPKLRVLNLNDNDLTDSNLAFPSLGPADYGSLRALFVANNRLDGSFIQEHLGVMCRLAGFDFCGNPFTDGAEDDVCQTASPEFDEKRGYSPTVVDILGNSLLPTLSANASCSQLPFSCTKQDRGDSFSSFQSLPRIKCVQMLPGNATIADAVADALRRTAQPLSGVAFENLDLDGNFLKAVPDGLGDISFSLSRLALNYNQLTSLYGLSEVPGLGRLEANANNLTSTDGLEYSTSLSRLDLQANQVFDISAIRNLFLLQHVRLGQNLLRSSDLDGLRNLGGSLTVLFLNDNQISSDGLANLANLTNLILLDLSSNLLDNVDFLAPCTKLETLMLNDNNLDNLDALSATQTIQQLQLNSNNFSSLDSLLAFSGLTALWMNNNRLSNIDAVSMYVDIESLKFSSNNIQQIDNSTFDNLKTLRSIDLDRNRLQRARFAGNQVLYYINLAHNNLTSASVEFDDLPFLSDLILNDNNLGPEFDSLSLLLFPRLRQVNIANNSISNLGVMPALPTLGYFLASGNLLQVVDFSGMSNLVRLDLSRNHLQNLDFITEDQDLQRTFCAPSMEQPAGYDVVISLTAADEIAFFQSLILEAGRGTDIIIVGDTIRVVSALPSNGTLNLGNIIPHVPYAVEIFTAAGPLAWEPTVAYLKNPVDNAINVQITKIILTPQLIVGDLTKYLSWCDNKLSPNFGQVCQGTDPFPNLVYPDVNTSIRSLLSVQGIFCKLEWYE